MWECKHKKKHFVAVNDNLGGAEKIYSCHHCGMMIAEIFDPKEAETYQKEPATIKKV
ncbi:hypothetical protein ACFL5G_05620 [Candidatus Margulisiibacteriota bacterium]